MRHHVLLIAAALAACAPPHAATTATNAATSTASPAAFVINDLAEHDGDIQGCSVMLSRADARPSAGDIFREDGVESGAKGFVRIDGALIQVDLVRSDQNEKGGTRTFADKTHATQIVETLTTGAAHQESDSVEQSGTLAVTHNGATQTLRVAGGTAC